MKRVQPKVRKNKRRGTKVDFGQDFNHETSYKTQFEVRGPGLRRNFAEYHNYHSFETLSLVFFRFFFRFTTFGIDY